ncbi:hypothetical protein [Hamadaea tsunoensis]|uniref:hypothetical protein n=1 Tax=Hamadaea tsunoensis TaxID=53368 RepID=UPI000415BED0|nr:hypothetical protein [Hamadaea tsunoensis]
MTGAATDGGDRMKVVGIYATKWRYPADIEPPSQDKFHGTRLEQFGEDFGDLLPRLPSPIANEEIPPDRIAFDEDLAGITVEAAYASLFVLPSDQVVATLTVECRTERLNEVHGPADVMLDEFTAQRFTIRGRGLTDYLSAMAPMGTENYDTAARQAAALSRPRWWSWRAPDVPPLDPPPRIEVTEQHQIVFLPRSPELDEDVIDALVYRDQPRYRQEFTQRQEPDELNTGPNRGIVTTNVSLIQGHDRALRDSVFLSTVQIVGTLARFRQIWDQAYSEVRRFRRDKQRDNTPDDETPVRKKPAKNPDTQTRDDLERLVDLLGNLEFDLTFSVEFPLMRIESYHSALTEVLELDLQAGRLSSMFEQLGGSIQSEITAIDIRSQRDSDVRNHRNEVAFNVFAIVGVPLGALLAFFGVSAKDVDPGQSMLNWRLYHDEYLLALLLGLLPLVVLAISRQIARGRQQRKQLRHEREKTLVNAVRDQQLRAARAVNGGHIVPPADPAS